MTKTLRMGCTTGTCATAAAMACAQMLTTGTAPSRVALRLPDGEEVRLPIEGLTTDGPSATASVRKDAGDDPDVTDGAVICVSLTPRTGVSSFHAGPGVGTVTKPGLALPVGEPAINPVPRRMILGALASVTDQAFRITVSIENGRALAEKTLNHRLGIEGGLSVLGTSGRVRPFSHEALEETLKCAVSVSLAAGVTAPILVPGHMGRRAAMARFSPAPDGIIEVSNAWGVVLDLLQAAPVKALCLVGHPGKLAKLAMGEWDTHSRRSPSASGWVRDQGQRVTGRELPESPTVQGVFDQLQKEDANRLGVVVATQIQEAVASRTGLACTLVLIDLQGALLGTAGEEAPWQK